VSKFSEDEYRALLDNMAKARGTAPPLAAKAPRRRHQTKTKTEAEYGLRLCALWRAGHLAEEPRYEAITLRLGQSCRYTPDYLCRPHAGPPQLHEVKGKHVWEDGIVKLKTAATMFPFFEFYLAQKKAGTWTVTRVEGG
jgi:hypothetical protein